jgi:hypothetical protein
VLEEKKNDTGAKKNHLTKHLNCTQTLKFAQSGIFICLLSCNVIVQPNMPKSHWANIVRADFVLRRKKIATNDK